ncbi:lysozyme family protein [Virgibacillus oceani]|uniref:Membrane protein YocA n=1 Tax=Virgibacillus oceani TaxID=1479511 RepID=A0A917H982_9BACI|nr:lysozyme family protein [Virgibacillus oceani]GGG71407.1 putative membrane protein YocA [Virgibacillus oceani]
MKKRTKKAIKQTMIITAMLCGAFVIVSILSFEQNSTPFQIQRTLISDEVLAYEPLVAKYADQYNVLEYKDVLLAMMMQESGGRGNDPMQSSESYCGKIGCIDEPELSIKQGVYYFSKTIEAAGGDIELAIQSYNFGRGFIDYVKAKSGNYTQEAAIDFSQKMYESAPDKSIYSCLREEAKKYNACYGDIYYVRDVMKYKEELTEHER